MYVVISVFLSRSQLWILVVAYFFSWSSTFFIFSYLINASIRGCIIGSLICGKSCKKEMKNIKKIKAKHQRSSRNIKNTINNDSNIGKSIVLMNTSWAFDLVTCSLSMKFVTGSPSFFSLSDLCCIIQWNIFYQII